jgi:hypothetical protein
VYEGRETLPLGDIASSLGRSLPDTARFVHRFYPLPEWLLDAAEEQGAAAVTAKLRATTGGGGTIRNGRMGGGGAGGSAGSRSAMHGVLGGVNPGATNGGERARAPGDTRALPSSASASAAGSLDSGGGLGMGGGRGAGDGMRGVELAPVPPPSRAPHTRVAFSSTQHLGDGGDDGGAQHGSLDVLGLAGAADRRGEDDTSAWVDDGGGATVAGAHLGGGTSADYRPDSPRAGGATAGTSRQSFNPLHPRAGAQHGHAAPPPAPVAAAAAVAQQDGWAAEEAADSDARVDVRVAAPPPPVAANSAASRRPPPAPPQRPRPAV